MRLLHALPLAAALACTAAISGTATVSVGDPARHTDAGIHLSQEGENLRLLARHIEALAQHRLPAGHHLQVELLDVDLAGRMQMSRRDGAWVRLVDSADFPRIQLRYTLSVNGQAVRSGEERLAELSPMRLPGPDTPLQYEKRLLNRWFHSQFGPQAVAATR